jgi:HD-GYP domain-containing protein (c-di-GMP phosphodiesterase class II)
VLEDVFRQGNLDNRIQKFRELGEMTVRAICHDDVVFGEILHVLCHDYHTFMHSANVAFYCVMLARSIGIQDRRELSAIATGGLLHDVGKLDIPAAVLNKPGRLEDKELTLIRRHPTIGFRKLSHQTELLLEQVLMVYQHHEQVNGSGYPVGCTTRELHLWGRICAVADVFDALTSNRPYRPALSVSDACAKMQAQSGTAFDEDILTCWMQYVSKT